MSFHRPRHRLRVSNALLALCAVSLICVGFLSPAAAQTDAAEPVFPTAPSTDERDDAQAITFPDVVQQSEHVYLAVGDRVDSVDAAGLVQRFERQAASRDVRILLGVDTHPTRLKGAAQLVRAMLMFGSTDALADDWVENGKRLGYVGKDWVVIGVLLPQQGTGTPEVDVQYGRNLTHGAAARQQVVLQISEWFTEQQRTEAAALTLDAAITAARSEDYVSLRYTLAPDGWAPNRWPATTWLLAGLTLACAGLVVGLLARRGRRTRHQKQEATRVAAAATELVAVRGMLRGLRESTPPEPFGDGVLAESWREHLRQRADRLTHAEAVLEQVNRQKQDQGNIEPDALRDLRAQRRWCTQAQRLVNHGQVVTGNWSEACTYLKRTGVALSESLHRLMPEIEAIEGREKNSGAQLRAEILEQFHELQQLTQSVDRLKTSQTSPSERWELVERFAALHAAAAHTRQAVRENAPGARAADLENEPEDIFAALRELTALEAGSL
ncbi:hypothetical protein [Glutamicibacter sp. PS]|uniref:hypothetical protein n=1 Tax=Glutamicibacter sp. PS TaxID=3075634 RepID=UPI00283C3F0E|nr:hypothetical protein [Glutamicibacter sp. PS]MDR4534259.1 hypothetical protein [Glutamicibacter sp. PS]